MNEFNKVAKTPLEEWISYFKTGKISPDAHAPGLPEAREKLRYYDMTPEERHAYDEHLNAIMIQNDVLDGARIEGLAEGRAEGRAEGLAEGRAKGLVEGQMKGVIIVARNLKAMNVPAKEIVKATGLSLEEIAEL